MPLGASTTFLALSGGECQRHVQYRATAAHFKGWLAVATQECGPICSVLGPAANASTARVGPTPQFWAPPKPFIASVMPVGVSRICEKRTTVTVSSGETLRP